MEHCWDWLVVLSNKMHILFIAGFYVTAKNKNHRFDLGEIGDNVPHVFLK